jgi:hypothetical protein
VGAGPGSSRLRDDPCYTHIPDQRFARRDFGNVKISKIIKPPSQGADLFFPLTGSRFKNLDVLPVLEFIVKFFSLKSYINL